LKIKRIDDQSLLLKREALTLAQQEKFLDFQI